MEKTKLLTYGGNQYQLGKFLPEEGSFILFRMIGAGMSSSSGAQSEQVEQPKSDAKPSGEEIVRSLVVGGFLRGLDQATYRLVHRSALACASVIEREASFPLVADSGKWAFPDLQYDYALLTFLITEVLVFNFADFFDGPGFAVMMGTPDSSQ